MSLLFEEENSEWFKTKHPIYDLKNMCNEKRIKVRSVYSKCTYILNDHVFCLLCQKEIKVGSTKKLLEQI